MGERGDDLSRVTAHGPPLLAEKGRAFALPVDTSRICLAGLSMGGFGSWHMAVGYPDADHDSWTATYGNQKVDDWMLAQKNTDFRT